MIRKLFMNHVNGILLISWLNETILLDVGQAMQVNILYIQWE